MAKRQRSKIAKEDTFIVCSFPNGSRELLKPKRLCIQFREEYGELQ
jgi:hypothetical protein